MTELFENKESDFSKEEALRLLSADPFIIRHYPLIYREDEDIILKASKKDRDSLAYMTERTRSDGDFIKKLVSLYGAEILIYAGNSLRQNDDYMIELIAIDPSSILFMENLTRDRQADFILRALKASNGKCFKFLIKPYLKIKGIIEEGVRLDYKNIVYVNDYPLALNKELTRAVLKEAPHYIKYFKIDFKDENDVVFLGELISEYKVRVKDIKEEIPPRIRTILENIEKDTHLR